MLPKINRIKKKKDFEIISKNGKNIKSNLFILKVLPNNFGISRFAFVISQKVSKKAVVRNKIRRRLSKVIEKKIKEIKPGIDIVFIVLKAIETNSFLEIEKEVIDIFINNKLIK